MFRKTFLFLTFGLLLIAGLCSILKANSTVTSTVDFDVVQPRAGDIRLRVDVPAYLARDNSGGGLTPGGILVHTSIDSLESYADGKDLLWTIMVEGYSQIDSLVYLRRQEFDLRSGRLIRTDRDTADYTGGAGKYAGTAHVDSLTFGRTPQMNLSLNTLAILTQPIAKTYATQLYFLHEKMVPGSVNGSLATYSLPGKMDSLTILANDSLAIKSTDTTYTAAIPGQYGFITLLLTAYGATADTIPLFGIEYQVKADGGSWAGPIDYYNYTAFPLIDSLAVRHGATKAYWPTTTPADSIRFRLINKSITGRSVVNKLKALWRD